MIISFSPFSPLSGIFDFEAKEYGIRDILILKLFGLWDALNPALKRGVIVQTLLVELLILWLFLTNTYFSDRFNLLLDLYILSL